MSEQIIPTKLESVTRQIRMENPCATALEIADIVRARLTEETSIETGFQAEYPRDWPVVAAHFGIEGD